MSQEISNRNDWSFLAGPIILAVALGTALFFNISPSEANEKPVTAQVTEKKKSEKPKFHIEREDVRY